MTRLHECLLLIVRSTMSRGQEELSGRCEEDAEAGEEPSQRSRDTD